jgi:hypothetical protein
MSKSFEKQARTDAKKAYRRPTVTAYGSIVELTKSGGVTTTDVGATFQN